AVKQAVAAGCRSAFAKGVGGSATTRLLSAFTLADFIPTKAQRKHGARWFRCDAVLARGSSLTPITSTSAPLLRSPLAANQALCLAGSARTTCDATHSFKATSVFKLKGKKYPGRTKVRTLARRGCDARVSTASFTYDAPTKAEWTTNKYVVCFSAHTNPVVATDAVNPTTTIAGPSTSVTVGTPVALTGESSDNVAVTSVGVSVRNSAGAYVQANGSLGTAAATLPVTVTGGAMNSALVTWSVALDSLPVGSYTATATARDAAGRTASATTSITVDTTPDTTKPTTTILGPGASVSVTENFVISGTASDNVAVSDVEVQLRNAAGNYLQDDLTTFAVASNALPATVTGLGSGTVSYDINTGKRAAGDYTVRVTATDPSGNQKTGTLAVTVSPTAASTTVIYDMNEAANATTMVDTGGNGLNGVINQAGLDTGVVVLGATAYSWAYTGPIAPPAKPERVITVSDHALLDAGNDTFTIELRYRTNTSFGNVTQKGQAASVGGQWKIQQPDGYPSCLFRNDTDQMAVQSTVSLSDNQWHVVRCIRTGDSVRMYVDDVYQGVKNSAVPIGPIDNSVPLTIGGKLNCDQIEITCDYFTGQIDYLKLTHS
ncbi:MAG: LamG-like jellyroll fold domain-containing protein, partial [Nocardioides sp.]